MKQTTHLNTFSYQSMTLLLLNFAKWTCPISLLELPIINNRYVKMKNSAFEGWVIKALGTVDEKMDRRKMPVFSYTKF
jgi:hypothetical protein